MLLVSLSSSAEGLPSARQGVDIYNSAGGNPRLIAFMKIGAAQSDLRYLAMLNAQIARQAQPRAFLAGQLIYFKELEQPLKIIDLRQKLFSYNGKRLDFRQKLSIEQRMVALERIVYPRRAGFSLWDWFLPFAYAATTDPAELSKLSAILAVGGVTSSVQCLNESEERNCTREFMGTLAAVGAVGGLRGQEPAASVFCSPDFKGGRRFVISGGQRSVLAISASRGEVDIRPAHLHSGSTASDHAARELLKACGSAQGLANMNIAMAYPAAPAALPQVHNQALAVRTPAVAPARAPAAVSVERFPPEQQGGAAR